MPPVVPSKAIPISTQSELQPPGSVSLSTYVAGANLINRLQSTISFFATFEMSESSIYKSYAAYTQCTNMSLAYASTLVGNAAGDGSTLTEETTRPTSNMRDQDLEYPFSAGPLDVRSMLPRGPARRPFSTLHDYLHKKNGGPAPLGQRDQPPQSTRYITLPIRDTLGGGTASSGLRNEQPPLHRQILYSASESHLGDEQEDTDFTPGRIVFGTGAFTAFSFTPQTGLEIHTAHSPMPQNEFEMVCAAEEAAKAEMHTAEAKLSRLEAQTEYETLSRLSEARMEVGKAHLNVWETRQEVYRVMSEMHILEESGRVEEFEDDQDIEVDEEYEEVEQFGEAEDGDADNESEGSDEVEEYDDGYGPMDRMALRRADAAW